MARGRKCFSCLNLPLLTPPTFPTQPPWGWSVPTTCILAWTISPTARVEVPPGRFSLPGASVSSREPPMGILARGTALA